MKYRAEIDGLRTVAVLPVIAYHLGTGAVPGGFTGVDIFFVISGYLICGIIHDAATKGQFSYLEFYKRRCLRILPPLMVVMLATLALGYFLLLPMHFRELTDSAAATSVFSSNFYFLSQTGYFEGPAEDKPFLHTWSLAVEEQFYIVFPVVLFLAIRHFPRHVTQILAMIIAASFAISVVGVLKKPNFAFYMLPTRAWELGIGGIIAVSGIESRTGRLGPALLNGLALLGVASLLVGMLGLDTHSRFPGWNALYPCIGSALIIFAGANTLVARFLALRPMVYIGMISYCLYLWHWPAIVFAKGFTDLGAGPRAALVLAVTFGLSVLSRYLIEIPFRYRLSSLPPSRIVAASVMAIVATAVGAAYLGHGPGNASRFPAPVLAIAAFSDYRHADAFHAQYQYQFRLGECFFDGNDASKGSYHPDTCLGVSPTAKNYLLVGDSHGAHLWRAISTAAGPGINVMQATAAGCAPLMSSSMAKHGLLQRNRCTELMDYIYQTWLPAHHVDGVIISGRWRPAWFAPLQDTLANLHSSVGNVVVLGPTIEYQQALPDLLAYEALGRQGLVAASIDPRVKSTDAALRQLLLQGDSTPYISVYDLVCPADACNPFSKDRQPSAFDYGHFTLSGATDVADGIVARMKADHLM